MKKELYQWMWRWHFIAGILCLPIVMMLSITGAIYLFKDDYESEDLEKLKQVEVIGNMLTYQEQWKKSEKLWDKSPEAMVISSENNQATKFTTGRFSHKNSFFIDPYSGKEKGRIIPLKTDMHVVRKLHGELLLGSFGTKIIELVASWMVVLVITGIYLFLSSGSGFKTLFHVRRKMGKRILYRDIHSLLGFWLSLPLLLVLIGGLPWTDVFGSGYKWLQDSTDSGFPRTWNSQFLKSEVEEKPLSLDYMVEKANNLGLKGEVSIGLPKDLKGVYSVSNSIPGSPWEMKIYHYDQYSGELIIYHDWNDIGLMMKVRLWVMAFHQGHFGNWNFILVFAIALLLSVLCITAILSYMRRKPSNSFGVPTNIRSHKMEMGVLMIIMSLSILLPMFGISLVLIYLFSKFKHLVLK